MKKACTIILIVLLSSLLFASNSDSKIISLDSSIYRDMDSLYLITGKTYPSKSRPWSLKECYSILFSIDKSSLSTSETKLYERIKSYLEAEEPLFTPEEILSVDLSLELNAKMQTHTNTDFDMKSEWVDRTIPPMVKGEFAFSVTDYFYFQSDVDLLISEYSDSDQVALVPSTGVGALIKPGDKAYYLTHSGYYSNSFETNFISQGHRMDLYWPQKAYVASTCGPFTMSLYRGKASIGNGKTGQLLLSDSNSNNMFRFSANTKYFKFDWINLFFQDERREQELPLEKFKTQMIHRFEIRPWSFLSFAISDSVMFSSPVLELGYFNPSYIFHNLYNRNCLNAIASLELSITPYKGLNLYFDGIMDQARGIGESDWEANAFGLIAGCEYNYAFPTGILKAYAEYAYTMPCLYRRDKVDFTTMTPHYAPNGLEAVDFRYIGYEYGPDSQVFELKLEYDSFNSFSIPLSLRLVRKGEMDFLTPHNTDGTNTNTSNIPDSTPYGNVIRDRMIISLSPTISLPYGFKITSNLSWIGKREYDKSVQKYMNQTGDLQFSLMLSYSI